MFPSIPSICYLTTLYQPSTLFCTDNINGSGRSDELVIWGYADMTSCVINLCLLPKQFIIANIGTDWLKWKYIEGEIISYILTGSGFDGTQYYNQYRD